jgi:hypothetical protein
LGLEVPNTFLTLINEYLRVSRNLFKDKMLFIKMKLTLAKNIKKSIINKDYYHPFLLPIHYFMKIGNDFKISKSYKFTIMAENIYLYLYQDTSMVGKSTTYIIPRDLKEVLQSILILFNYKLYYNDVNCFRVSDDVRCPVKTLFNFLKKTCPFQIDTKIYENI